MGILDKIEEVVEKSFKDPNYGWQARRAAWGLVIMIPILFIIWILWS